MGILNAGFNKKKLAFLLVFVLILTALILFIYNSDDTIIKAVKADYPGQPTITFVIDSRNIQSIQFVTDILDYLDRNQLLINVAVIFQNSKVVSFNGRYQVIDKRKIRNLRELRDTFIFFGHERKQVLRGTLSNIPNPLLDLINPQYELDNQNKYRSLQQSVDMAEEISFFADIKRYLVAEITCFTFFDELCQCNNSINTIHEIMEIEEHGSKIRHFVVPMFSYSQEDIEFIKSNNDYSVEFLLPSSDDIGRWGSIKTDALHKHPLNELVILVNSRGKILLFSNKWEDYLLWREEHINDGIKEGDDEKRL